ncbi:MAG: hypothetical protein R2784_09740 [Saprospiraceae bacterium]
MWSLLPDIVKDVPLIYLQMVETIMSYCHLVSGVGINFNNGFGPNPGDKIRYEISNAAVFLLEAIKPTRQNLSRQSYC